MQSLRQPPSESVKEYIDREEFVWEQLRGGLRAMDKAESEEDMEPIHGQFRDMLFFSAIVHSRPWQSH
eukprot:3338430-Lingulodinium_polyedra.AAC.1